MSSRPLPKTASAHAVEALSPSSSQRTAWGTVPSLRVWQAEAFNAYMASQPRDFLAAATPGTGKTTFVLRVATEFMAKGAVRRVTAVCPTEHLKAQWSESAVRMGLILDPDLTNAQREEDNFFDGVCVTYAQAAVNPGLCKRRTAFRPTLVILDEIHHGGDALSWGDGIREAFQGAAWRLSLTGTFFRSDDSPIPFVEYAGDGDGVFRLCADYIYGYAEALCDGVVRPVMFLSYSGQMRWQTKQGDVIEATLGEPLTKDMTGQAWRTALSPADDWIQAVLAVADECLTAVRKSTPDAGGLVIATDQRAARAYAERLEGISGQRPTVVLSDDVGTSDRIAEFSAGDERWMIAVRMVSEGVDVPRLAVGVCVTSASTLLFFAQAIGHFVCAHKCRETAVVFFPSVPQPLGLTAEMEVECDHVLGRKKQEGGWDDELLERANPEEQASDQLALPGFKASESDVSFDRAFFDGGEFGSGAKAGSDEEADFLGIPGLLEPEQVTTLLRKRQAAQPAQPKKVAPVSDPRRRCEVRKELIPLVSAWAQKSGQSHAFVHVELRRICGGPEVAWAFVEQIESRIGRVCRWFVGRMQRLQIRRKTRREAVFSRGCG